MLADRPTCKHQVVFSLCFEHNSPDIWLEYSTCCAQSRVLRTGLVNTIDSGRMAMHDSIRQQVAYSRCMWAQLNAKLLCLRLERHGPTQHAVAAITFSMHRAAATSTNRACRYATHAVDCMQWQHCGPLCTFGSAAWLSSRATHIPVQPCLGLIPVVQGKQYIT